ncbi:MAG TPA: hypothetical protein VLM83_08135, partial [Anaerolineales bacterium]|nr:hypothetical protein [Anaerolineales bacterium]
LIEAALDDRAQKTGRPVDEDMIVEVLKEFGPPEKMAASYLPERYLIGPQLFPAFINVVKIALPIVIILAGLGLALRLGRSDLQLPGVVDAFAEGFAGMFNTGLQVLGTIVLIFALLEYFAPGLKSRTLPKNLDTRALKGEWDPRSLPKPAPAPQKVGVVGLSVEIAFTVVAIVIFNFYPQLIGIGYSGTEWVSIPVLAEVFFERYLPWLNVVWALQIVLDAILLGRGRWETGTGWFYVALKAMSVVINLAMLTGPSLIALTAETLAANSAMGMGAAEILVDILNQVVKWGLIIAVIAGSVDLIKQAFRLLFQKINVVALVKEK